MVSRSSGCSLCVQRRVKCDERLPGCLRCETYGKPCPGYTRDFKFVAGKPYRSRRRPKISENSSDVPSSLQGGSNSVSLPMALERTNPHELGAGDINMMQCLPILTDEISHPFPTTSGYVISRWFLLLPHLYGQNKTLDAAMRCFTAHHIGSLTQNQQAVRYARSAYLDALRKVRYSLSNPSESLSSNVYCSVLLLCLYELFTNSDDSDCWMKHAKGLSQLTAARGPTRYQNYFDSVLLKASRGLIVMYSLFGGQQCILAADDWHSVMEQQYNTSLSSDLDALVEEFFAYFTFSPMLIHEWFGLKEADKTDPETLKRVSKMVLETLDMQKKIITWHNKFSRVVPTPHEVLSETNDQLYPVVLSYSDVNCATIFCGYYAYMVLIHEILRTLSYPGEHLAMVAYFRDRICMSVAYTAQGLLGPYRMGFPLQVAYQVADPPTKSWIQNCLSKLSEIYGALHPRNFEASSGIY